MNVEKGFLYWLGICVVFTVISILCLCATGCATAADKARGELDQNDKRIGRIEDSARERLDYYTELERIAREGLARIDGIKDIQSESIDIVEQLRIYYAAMEDYCNNLREFIFAHGFRDSDISRFSVKSEVVK